MGKPTGPTYEKGTRWELSATFYCETNVGKKHSVKNETTVYSSVSIDERLILPLVRNLSDVRTSGTSESLKTADCDGVSVRGTRDSLCVWACRPWAHICALICAKRMRDPVSKRLKHQASRPCPCQRGAVRYPSPGRQRHFL